MCNYFTIQQFCKFGEKCAFQHNISKNQSDIHKLNEKIALLEGSIKLLKKQIEVLIELQNTSIIMKKSNDALKCEKCEYTASSSKVLKRHKTMKHKTIEEDNSLVRAETLFFPPPPVDADQNQYTHKSFKHLNLRPFKSDFFCAVRI